jgi:excinuclease UvrABC nuclease subunit
MSAASRTFKIKMSERCFRFKPDALPSHAPAKPGVYEFVTFDAAGTPKVLYVGLALEKSVFQSLSDHLMNKAEPTSEKLFAAVKDVYFDYVADADIAGLDDLKDIAGALMAKHKPQFNAGAAPTSGQYASVTLQEVD